jgi:uncharacterized protein YjiS (DUF1127 family)
LATLLPAQQQEHPMPPQQTTFTSEAGRDSAGLRLDATGDPLAAAPPDVSIAALRDAFSAKQAVGPPVAPTRSVLGWLRGYWNAFRKWRQRERLRVNLLHLSDRELMDIGVAPNDIDYIAARRAFDRLRDGAAYLWLSRGVM